MSRTRLNVWQLFNMSFGFLGIQFGWGLQLANMSAVYERLGAKTDQIPGLWLAAPLTGLLVQPVIGALSDRTAARGPVLGHLREHAQHRGHAGQHERKLCERDGGEHGGLHRASLTSASRRAARARASRQAPLARSARSTAAMR